ncbi:MAG: alpha/beta fold hydrolase [Puia sp.]|nr:alpha/beta fold hydrolase [Puia sp.]
MNKTHTPNRKIIVRWLKVIILLYCGIGIALYYLQDRLLFHPVAVDPGKPYDFALPHDEINIPYDNDTRLNIVRFPPAHSADLTDSSTRAPKGVVLYFHGNKQNISRYAMYAPNFTAKGYEVWMLDYPGFGKSRGPFTEQKLYDYALITYKLARSRFKPSEIIIYGKSLGTCIAAELADVRDCRRLILETPCYSMQSLISHYLPIYPVGRMFRYRFPINEFLPAVTAPVTIFHGTDDGIIPYSNAERLKPLLKPGDEFVTIEKGSHNNLNDFALFHRKLDSLLER